MGEKIHKKFKITQVIQGPLVVVMLGILLNELFKGTSLYIESSHLVILPVAGNLNEFLGMFTFFNPQMLFNKDVLLVGATIAIVGSLETLLCVEAADKLDPQKRITPTNRELIAQGVGNIFSGAIGGLPVTQVIVRSSANIQSGAKTKLSAIVHGILLLVSVIFIPNILNLIPLASLAAILIIVGYKLAKPSVFRKMYQAGISEFIPFMVTILGIVFTDLLIGIVLGLIVAIFQILYNNYTKPYKIIETKKDDKRKIHIELSDNLTFINKASMIATIARIESESDLNEEKTEVVIDASRTYFIHPDIIEIIEDFQISSKYKNIELTITGVV